LEEGDRVKITPEKLFRAIIIWIFAVWGLIIFLGNFQNPFIEQYGGYVIGAIATLIAMMDIQR